MQGGFSSSSQALHPQLQSSPSVSQNAQSPPPALSIPQNALFSQLPRTPGLSAPPSLAAQFKQPPLQQQQQQPHHPQHQQQQQQQHQQQQHQQQQAHRQLLVQQHPSLPPRHFLHPLAGSPLTSPLHAQQQLLQHQQQQQQQQQQQPHHPQQQQQQHQHQQHQQQQPHHPQQQQHQQQHQQQPSATPTSQRQLDASVGPRSQIFQPPTALFPAAPSLLQPQLLAKQASGTAHPQFVQSGNSNAPQMFLNTPVAQPSQQHLLTQTTTSESILQHRQVLLRRQQQQQQQTGGVGEWRTTSEQQMLPRHLNASSPLPEEAASRRVVSRPPLLQTPTTPSSNCSINSGNVMNASVSSSSATSCPSGVTDDRVALLASRIGRQPRRLLEGLSFPRVLFVSECFTANRYNVSSSMLRKNYENFILLKHKQALVTPGPKKAKDFPRGVVIAYGSGFIVSVATRPHFVGLAPPPASAATSASSHSSTGNAPSGGTAHQIYADWLRRKFRSHELEPSCAANGKTRFLAFLTRADLPQKQLALQQAPQQLLSQQQIFLEELHDFLLLHLPHWTVIYDPEIAPFLIVSRKHEALSPRQAAAASAVAANNALLRLEMETQRLSRDRGEAATGAGTEAGVSSNQFSSFSVFASAAEEAEAAASSASKVCEAGELPFREVKSRLLLPLTLQPVHLWPMPAKVLTYCRREAALFATVASAVESEAFAVEKGANGSFVNSASSTRSPSSPAFRAEAEIRVTLLLGAGHIVGVCRGSSISGPLSQWLGGGGVDFVGETREAQAATSSAIADIWAILRFFVGTAAERFAPPAGPAM